MNDDDLDRLLAGAFDARARAAVPDDTAPPPPRFAEPGAGHGRRRAGGRRMIRRLAPAAAAAAVVAAISVGAVLATSGDHDSNIASRISAAAVPASAVRAAPDAQPVHVKLLNSDGQTYGVGMPVIAYFSRAITDARSFQRATTVTVNGKPLQTAWYFEKSDAGHGPLEAHLRPRAPWPAHAAVHVDIAARDVTAGKGLGFDDSLTLDFHTGAQNVLLVDDTTHELTLTSDGKVVGKYRVSLGARATPTMSGDKVIMDKGKDVAMSGPGYRDEHVKYTQQLTYSGEYLHAAPWNAKNIAEGNDTSNGCTNLSTKAALALYRVTNIGDIVRYPNADGPKMQLGSGYGDWNVTWGTWLTGGAVPTR